MTTILFCATPALMLFAISYPPPVEQLGYAIPAILLPAILAIYLEAIK